MSRFLKASIPVLIGTVLYQGLIIRKLSHVLLYQHHMVNTLSDGTTYLVDLLEQHEVELNDFDRIALNDIFEATK